MGASPPCVGCTDTSFLHRLILIYQLISKDEALQTRIRTHGGPSLDQPCEGAWGPCGSCSLCDAQLHAKAAADVAALRALFEPDSPPTAETVAATSPGGSVAEHGPCQDCKENEPNEEKQQKREPYGTGAPKTAGAADDASKEKGQCSVGCTVPVAADSSAAEPLVFAYDPNTGGAVPYSLSGISTLSLPPAAVRPGISVGLPVGPPPHCRAGRIFVDGVFDLLHSGHFNALRQARLLGKRLIVGVNSDRGTYAAKGCWPLYTEEERAEIVASCKWVDEVVIGTPYEVSTDLLDALNCEAAAHGDDWAAGADGRDAYAQPRAAGRMLVFKRTEGISSTSITRRLLEATAHMCEERVAVDRPQLVGHFARKALENSEVEEAMSEGGNNGLPGARVGPSSTPYGQERSEKEAFRDSLNREERKASQGAGVVAPDKAYDRGPGKMGKRRGDLSVFMSSKRLLQFIGEAKKPKPGDRVVYVDGSFDVLHVGHVRILKIAKEMGDYLIVGIHDDATVSAVKGLGFPVMNVNERALNVLDGRANASALDASVRYVRSGAAMRMVDEVIIGAPWTIPKYLLEMLGIHIVVRGTRIDCTADSLGGILGSDKERLSSARIGAEGHAIGPVDATSELLLEEDEDPYRVPKELGIYREVESFSSWTTRELVSRLLRNRKALSDSLRHRYSC
ncbi:ethanolamine-phosphate cytidylyltransferase [Cyclospora cayetanensis]|uniref:ethanolamine-phosphate cytidylyltransferase n=1 Tax=Cyclospora cayetanensis TaxID=88456 RepID=A0A1D3CYY1_9EIME|nr:ethanolamine-phosphate cytidylyltransferase [Cyclospora cayetanensis]